MKPQTEDFGRSVDNQSDGEPGEACPPKWNGPIERNNADGQVRSPEHETAGSGSKVTWQGFIDWMTSRGA